MRQNNVLKLDIGHIKSQTQNVPVCEYLYPIIWSHESLVTRKFGHMKVGTI